MTHDNAVRELSPAAAVVRTGDRGRTLLEDLRAAVVDAAVAVVLSGIAFGILILRLRAGTDTAALEMPEMIRNGGVWSYSLSQAVGWAALAWSWLTILLGVSLPVWARQRRPRLRARAERLHRSTSLTVIGLMVAHAVLLSWDKMGDTLFTEFVPWTTSYVPGRFPQTLGILSFYLAVLLGFSFYFRNRIGAQIWRALHRYFVPAAYILAVWHTLAYGSDVKLRNALWIGLWLMQIPIILAFAVRLPFWPNRSRRMASERTVRNEACRN
jgi:sulfoxide reductase heme-binding subunit YedZ